MHINGILMQFQIQNGIPESTQVWHWIENNMPQIMRKPSSFPPVPQCGALSNSPDSPPLNGTYQIKPPLQRHHPHPSITILSSANSIVTSLRNKPFPQWCPVMIITKMSSTVNSHTSGPGVSENSPNANRIPPRPLRPFPLLQQCEWKGSYHHLAGK